MKPPAPALPPAERAMLELLLARWVRGKVFGTMKRWAAAGRPDFWSFVADDFGRSLGAITVNNSDTPTQEPQTVPSTSDQRVVNNTMRHNYRVLSDQEKADMQALKDAGLAFLQQLHKIGGTPETIQKLVDKDGDQVVHVPGPYASRELSLAATKVEEAVMWAVKHITA